MKEPILIDPGATSTQVVGVLHPAIVSKYQLACSSHEVQMYPGAIKHIKKRHPGIFEQYYHLIPDILENPDYIGQNPKEPNSVELVKIVNEHFLVAIKLDPSGYLFLSTFYDLKNGKTKVEKRIRNGRLMLFTDLLATIT
ncbi:MAG: PBECR2 nuclease fold domain-containing protein [Heyndrickxia sp.]